MPELYIITSDWTEQQWFSTGGTRAKKYLLSPDGKFYYFKRSQFKPANQNKLGKDFKYEFWNEIIAYEVGSVLGFHMLRYDMAIDGEIMGCISESMIAGDQELVEGVKYLQAYKTEYDPANKDHRILYNFDLIENTLSHSYISRFIENLLEIIVFDTLIGNGDRHQENWAFITTKRLFTDEIPKLTKPESAAQKALKLIKSQEEKIKAKGQELPAPFYITNYEFAPIYDNGSSLARELLPEKVEQLLNSDEELKKYIRKGPSEIHWGNKKISHFDLIRNLLTSTHKETIKKIIDRVISSYNSSQIERIINEIDQKVPETHLGYKIPETRKRLIFKIITLRFELLKGLINERV